MKEQRLYLKGFPEDTQDRIEKRLEISNSDNMDASKRWSFEEIKSAVEFITQRLQYKGREYDSSESNDSGNESDSDDSEDERIKEKLEREMKKQKKKRRDCSPIRIREEKQGVRIKSEEPDLRDMVLNQDEHQSSRNNPIGVNFSQYDRAEFQSRDAIKLWTRDLSNE